MATYEPKTDRPATPAAILDAGADAKGADAKRDLRGAGYEEGVQALAPAKEQGKAPTKDTAKDKDAADKERLAKLQASWEAALGKWLGGKLFEVVRDNVSPAALMGYAKQGVEAMGKSAGGAAGGLLKDKDGSAAVNKFVTALMPEIEAAANKWLAGESGQKVLGAVSGWVMDHPKTVAASLGGAAIGAAVAAYLSDMDIPTLEHVFKLGDTGLSVGGSVDVGSLQHIAFQAATASIAYKSKGLNASLKGEVDKDGKGKATLAASAEGKVGKEGTLNAKGSASLATDGTLKASVDGGLKTKVGGTPLEVAAGLSHSDGKKVDPTTKVNARVSFGEKGEQKTVSGSYNPGDGSFDLKLDQTTLEGALTAGTTLSRDAKGLESQGLAASYAATDRDKVSVRGDKRSDGATGGEVSYEHKAGKDGGLYAALTAGTGTHKGLDAKVGWSEDKLKSELHLAMKDGLSTMGGSASYGGKTGLHGSASADLNLTDAQLQKFAVQLGWKDPEKFRSFLIGYKAEWMADNAEYAHEFNVMLEYAVGRVAGRLTGTMGVQGGQVTKGNLDLTGAYDLNKDWKLLGSVGMAGNSMAAPGAYDPTLQVGAGVQYKNVAIKATYTPESKSWGVGLTIPF